MASFKSSASSVGYDPARVPNNARRIAEEGEQRINYLRDAYQADIENRNNYLQGLKEDNARVMQQVESNKRLEDSYQQAFKQAYEQKYRVEKANIERESKRPSQLDRLSQFSQTLLKEASTLKEQDNKDQQEYGQWLVYQFGVSPDDLSTLKNIESDMKAENVANNAVVNNLRERGATPDQIQAIRNLDGWRLYGAEIAMAKQGKGQYHAFLNNPNNRAKEYDMGDGRTMSLTQAETEGNTADYNHIRNMMFREFNRNYSKLSPEFASEYLYPGLRAVDESDTLQFQTKVAAKLEQETIDEQNQTLENLDFTKDPNAFQNAVIDAAGGPKATKESLKVARTELLTRLQERASAGSLSMSEWQDIKTSTWTQDGKSKSFIDQWQGSAQVSDIINDIDDNVTRRTIDDYKQDSAQREMRAEQAEERIVERMLDDSKGTPDEKSRADLANAFLKEHGRQLKGVAAELVLGRNKINESLAKELIARKLNSGDTITPEFVASLDLNSTVKSELLAYAGQSNKTGTGASSSGMGNIDKTLKDELKSALGKTNVDEIATDVNYMLPYAQAYVDTAFTNYLNGGASVFDAQNLALKDFREAVRKGEGDFARSQGKYGEEFNILNAAPDISKRENIKSIAFRADAEGASVLDDPTAFGDINDPNSLAFEMLSTARTKQITNAQRVIARSFPDLSTKEVINSVLRTNGVPEEKLLPMTMFDVETQVDEDLRYLVTDRPSQAKVFRAVNAQSDRLGLVGLDRYRPMLNLMQSVESSNDTVHGGYDALNRGGRAGGTIPIGSSTGTNVFERPLMDFSLGEILQLQESDSLHAVGRYQFIENTIRDLFDRNLLPPEITLDSKFDQTTQDIMAVAYLHDTIETYRGSDGYVLQGLGRRWIGLKNVSRTKLQEALEAIKVDGRFQAPSFFGLDLDGDVLTKFYKAGNIGPTSTGQHTDVKQLDNPRTDVDESRGFFKYTDLNDYVVVQDRDLGQVPLGGVPETGDFASHTVRGSHGRDYGTYEGDNLYLKNGAKVISSNPTEHGDAVVVELPDGRRFQFLHGTQSK